MSKLGTLLIGIVIGAAGLYTAMGYHVIRAADGHHFVPKQSFNFSECYIDIREFTISDWSEHAGLAQDLVKADKSELLTDAAQATLQNTVGEIFQKRR